MNQANKIQVGGNHYGNKNPLNLQHWDMVDMFNLDYFQGQITKYVMRWRDKNGVQDLEKAKHFLEKYIELEKLKLVEKETNPYNLSAELTPPITFDPLKYRVCPTCLGAKRLINIGHNNNQQSIPCFSCLENGYIPITNSTKKTKVSENPNAYVKKNPEIDLSKTPFLNTKCTDKLVPEGYQICPYCGGETKNLEGYNCTICDQNGLVKIEDLKQQ